MPLPRLRLTSTHAGSASAAATAVGTVLPLEPRVAGAEHHALQPAVAGDQLQLGRQERAVVLVGRRVEQVDAGQVALAALRPPPARRCCRPPGTSPRSPRSRSRPSR